MMPPPQRRFAVGDERVDVRAEPRHEVATVMDGAASRTLVDVLVERVGETDGPEIVVVMARNSKSRLEEQSMANAYTGCSEWQTSTYRWVSTGRWPTAVHRSVCTHEDLGDRRSAVARRLIGHIGTKGLTPPIGDCNSVVSSSKDVETLRGKV